MKKFVVFFSSHLIQIKERGVHFIHTKDIESVLCTRRIIQI